MKGEHCYYSMNDSVIKDKDVGLYKFLMISVRKRQFSSKFPGSMLVGNPKMIEQTRKSMGDL